jgi:hypothetical protein
MRHRQQRKSQFKKALHVTSTRVEIYFSSLFASPKCHICSLIKSTMNTTSSLCGPNLENHFGPEVKNYPGILNFTLLFEQSIISIIPSSLSLLVFLLRFALLSQRSFESRRNSVLYSLKLIFTSHISDSGYASKSNRFPLPFILPFSLFFWLSGSQTKHQNS